METVSPITYGLTQEKMVSGYYNTISNLITHESFIPFFVTTAFVSGSIRTGSFIGQVAEAWKRYGWVYPRVLGQLMNDYQRKPFLQPLTFDFVDFPGSDKTGQLNLTETANPHIHSIYLVQPKLVEIFRSEARTGFAAIGRPARMSFLNDIHVVEIENEDNDNDKDPLPDLLSYCTKAIKNARVRELVHRGDIQFWNQLPISKDERPGKRERKPSLRDWDFEERIIQRMRELRREEETSRSRSTRDGQRILPVLLDEAATSGLLHLTIEPCCPTGH